VFEVIGIIDYKAGNAPSVLNAYNKLEVSAELVSNPERITDYTHIVLPGVGAAKATMESLRETGFDKALEYVVFKLGKPFLGICVGMQILFEHSEEEDTICLGWLDGNVLKFPPSVIAPQMGWNKTVFRGKSALSNNGESEYFYFVNSYYVKPYENEIILAETDYGGVFCSAIRKKNIYGIQFHAEKSGSAGLSLLKNFAIEKGGSYAN